MAYREDAVKPTFVVPLTEAQFKRKVEAVRCYASQFEGATAAGEIFPTGQPLVERIEDRVAALRFAGPGPARRTVPYR